MSAGGDNCCLPWVSCSCEEAEVQSRACRDCGALCISWHVAAYLCLHGCQLPCCLCCWGWLRGWSGQVHLEGDLLQLLSGCVRSES